MDKNLVLLARDGRVATLTLNRPSKLNALTPQVFAELSDHLRVLSNASDIDCVILRGSGRAFCGGHDLEAIGSADANSRFHEAETIDALEALPMPTIAEIHGYCLTGGLELALACDLLVCSESAKFGDTHGKWGLVPVWGMSVRLPERVGRSKAKELAFTSRQIDGKTAESIGLVDCCIPDDELESTVSSVVAEVCTNSAGTNRIYKSLFAANAGKSRRDALDFERLLPYGLPDDRHLRLRG